MSERSKSLEKATKRLLAPLARFYMKSRLGYGLFEEAARFAFVMAAIEQTRMEGEKPTQGRIATKTGLTLHEVRRLMRGRKEPDTPSHDRRARAARVLDGLWTDPEFLDAYKQPLAIRKRGPAPSIVTAVKRYAGTERAEPILRELVKANALRQLEDGRYKAVRRTCINVPGDKEGMDMVADDVAHHLEASLENLGQSEEARHYVRWVQSEELDPDEAKIAYRRVLENSMLLIEGAGETLDHKRYRKKSGDPRRAARIRVAVQVSRTLAGSRARQGTTNLTPLTPPGRRGPSRQRRSAGEAGAD